MERLERKPKSGAGEKTFVAFRATGWPGVDNALLTSTVQTAQFKQQGNKWRGQLKVLMDHTGASIEPISVNGPQGETRADALQKLETHYAMLASWVGKAYGGLRDGSDAPSTFTLKYEERLGGDEPPSKKRKNAAQPDVGRYASVLAACKGAADASVLAARKIAADAAVLAACKLAADAICAKFLAAKAIANPAPPQPVAPSVVVIAPPPVVPGVVVVVAPQPVAAVHNPLDPLKMLAFVADGMGHKLTDSQVADICELFAS